MISPTFDLIMIAVTLITAIYYYCKKNHLAALFWFALFITNLHTANHNIQRKEIRELKERVSKLESPAQIESGAK